MKNKLLIGYFIVGVIHVLSLLILAALLGDITKVLLMPLLIAYVFTELRNKNGFGVLLFAVLFCWAGDILLIFTEQNELFFLLGLGAFLLGHIGYIFTFRKCKASGKNKSLPAIYYGLPLIYAIGLLLLLIPKLGDMTVPVVAYAVVISMMCVAAMWRWGNTSVVSFKMVIYGAILFVISDSIIAVNKFYAPFSAASLLIMITYILAQYLIVVGLRKHFVVVA